MAIKAWPTATSMPCFDVNFRHNAGARRRDRAHRLLGFELHDRLVFFDLLAFGDQDADDGAGLYTFSELGKFDVHGKFSRLRF